MSTSGPRSADRILRLLREGDERQRDKLFADLRVRFVLLAKRRVGAAEAEDVAHDACLTIMEKFRALPEETNFAAWALQILRNKVGNRLQHRSRVTEYPFDETRMPSGAPDVGSIESRLADCLRQLLAVNRRYVRALNFAQLGFSAAEVARRIGVSTGNLYVILNRARRELKKCMKMDSV